MNPNESNRTGLYRLVVIALSLAFFVTPYLVTWEASAAPGRDRVIGAELSGDGLVLALHHGVLQDIQSGEAGLAATLTAPWWGQMHSGQRLWRPVPLFIMGVASQMTGAPYNPDNPGGAPLPFHLLTLAFHILATALLFNLALELMGSDKIALIAAALFATLPVHGEAIFDVAGIAELSAAAFSFAAWIMWLQAGEKPHTRLPQFAACLAFVALAALSKESAFALPLVFLLVDAGRRGPGLQFKAALSKWPAYAVIALLLMGLVGLRIQVVGGLLPVYGQAALLDNPLLGTGPLERMANAVRVLVSGVLAMVGINPLRGAEGFHFNELFGFSSDYSASQIKVQAALSFWNLVALAALTLSILASFRGAKRCGLRGGLWLGMLGAMLITSNLLLPIGTAFGERLLYFPSALLVMLIATWLVRLGKMGLVAGLLLSIGGGLWTLKRGADWQSPHAQFKATKTDAPMSAKAHFNWGLYLLHSDLTGLAIGRFEKALGLFPQYAAAQGNLGLALAADLRYDEAVEALISDLEIQLAETNWQYQPEPYGTLLGPAELLTSITELRINNPAVNQPQANLDWLDGLLAKGYRSPHALALRGLNLLKFGRTAEAEQAYRDSLQVEPTFVAVRYLGELLRKTGRSAGALELYRESAADTAHFRRHERTEFMLRQADGELASAPAQAIATLDSLVGECAAMAPEQLFRYHWTWAQAAMDTMPVEPAAEADAFREIETRLMAALSHYTVADEATFAARYSLVYIFNATRNYGQLIATAEELLRYKNSPLLRTNLASAYGATGDVEKSLANWRAAAADLVDENGGARDLEGLMAARRGLLMELSQQGDWAAIEQICTDWKAADDAALQPWSLTLALDCHLGGGQFEAAWLYLEKLAADYPDFPPSRALIKPLRCLISDAGEYPCAMFFAQKHLEWRHFEKAATTAEAAFAEASSDAERGYACGPWASALANLGRKAEALGHLEAALALELPTDLRKKVLSALEEIKRP